MIEVKLTKALHDYLTSKLEIDHAYGCMTYDMSKKDKNSKWKLNEIDGFKVKIIDPELDLDQSPI